MKKIKLTALIFGLISLSGHLFGQDWSLGLKAGGDLTSLKEKETNTFPPSSDSFIASEGFRYLPNFQIGFVSKVQLNDHIGLIIEPGFIQKGAKDIMTGTNFRFGYINVPVLFYYSPIKKINLEVGPELGYRLYFKNIGDRATLPYSKLDFSAIIGLSYDINRKINIGSRYSYGLSRTRHDWLVARDKDHAIIGTIDIDQYNRCFEVFVRYYLFKN